MQQIKTLIPKKYPRTFKQSEFARLVAEEGMTSSEAYRIAYNPSKNATKKSIHEQDVLSDLQLLVEAVYHSGEAKDAAARTLFVVPGC